MVLTKFRSSGQLTFDFRLFLALLSPTLRRPAGQHRKPKGRRNAPLFASYETGQGAREQRSFRNASIALPERIGFPGGAQLPEQRERIGVEQLDLLHIRDRQGE